MKFNFAKNEIHRTISDFKLIVSSPVSNIPKIFHQKRQYDFRHPVVSNRNNNERPTFVAFNNIFIAFEFELTQRYVYKIKLI